LKLLPALHRELRFIDNIMEDGPKIEFFNFDRIEGGDNLLDDITLNDSDITQ
jgi:hypothetical protein